MFGACGGGTILVLSGMIAGLVALVRSSYSYRTFHTLRLLLLLWDDASIRRQRPSMTTPESYIGGTPSYRQHYWYYLISTSKNKKPSSRRLIFLLATPTHTHTTLADVLRYADEMIPRAGAKASSNEINTRSCCFFIGYRHCFA